MVKKNVLLVVDEDQMDLVGWHYVVGILNMEGAADNGRRS